MNPREADQSLEMPPLECAQPTEVERQRVAACIEAARNYRIDRYPGDPGPVLARRLSNAEEDSYRVDEFLTSVR
ncbi:MAG: hypothetical protein ACK496_02520 [Acidobacteriota bacterium]